MNLKDAFQGMKEAGKPAPQWVAPPARPAAKKTGKSSNPNYEPVKVYLLGETHKLARRRWEDEARGDRDFSDLVQKLLEEYLSS
jgi:hypothetical protein